VLVDVLRIWLAFAAILTRIHDTNVFSFAIFSHISRFTNAFVCAGVVFASLRVRRGTWSHVAVSFTFVHILRAGGAFPAFLAGASD